MALTKKNESLFGISESIENIKREYHSIPRVIAAKESEVIKAERCADSIEEQIQQSNRRVDEAAKRGAARIGNPGNSAVELFALLVGGLVSLEQIDEYT